jgi:hypothetical protein
MSMGKSWHKANCRLNAGVAFLLLYIDDMTVDELIKDHRFSEIGPVSENMAEILNKTYADKIATGRCVQITIPPLGR